jgi:hypothetical protein
VWYHRAELGDPVEVAHVQGRHNRWMLNTARMEVENATKKTRLYGLILSNGSLDVTDPKHPSFFIWEIRASNRYKGLVQTIDPCRMTQAGAPGQGSPQRVEAPPRRNAVGFGGG